MKNKIWRFICWLFWLAKWLLIAGIIFAFFTVYTIMKEACKK